VVSYRDNVIPSNSLERGALFQAKRLHRSARGGAFTLYDTFKYFDPEQLRRLAEREKSDLIRKDHTDCSWDMSFCFYLFYCPRPEAYDRQSQEDLRCYAIPTFKEYYFHHLELSFDGLAEVHHLFDTASDPARHFPAVLTSRIGWLVDKYFEERDGKLKGPHSHEPVLARHVYERLWDHVMPFSWFLVYRMLLGDSGSCGLNALRLVRGQLGDSDEVTVMPRYVLALGVEVGTPRG